MFTSSFCPTLLPYFNTVISGIDSKCLHIFILFMLLCDLHSKVASILSTKEQQASRSY